MPARSLTAVFFLTIIIACIHRVSEKINIPEDFILEEKDLIPEGIAFDTVSGSVFVSSTYKRKIVRIDSTGQISDFIKEKQDSIWSTIGMEADEQRRHLWVVSSQAREVLPLLDPDSLQWRSAVYQYDLENDKLIQSWRLTAKNVFLNDLTVDANGDVYITESMKNSIYVVRPGADSIELFLTLSPFTFLNGINFSDQPGQLFVSASEGILKIDVKTRQFKPLKTAPGVDAKEIDGLAFYKNSFIAHQSTKVVKLFLNDKRDSITHSALLDSGKDFDSSTTGETGNGHYYFIVNSQVRSGIDFKKQALKPLDSLEKVIIRKIAL